MGSTSNPKSPSSHKVRLGPETWAAIRRCYEADPDISALDAAIAICNKQDISEIPSAETVRSRVRRNGWKKRTSESYSQGLAKLHADILEPDPALHDPSLKQGLTAGEERNARSKVLGRHRRDLKALNDQLDVGLALVFDAAGVVDGRQVREANPESMKLGYSLIRATSEVINGKVLLVKAEREAYGLKNEEEGPILPAQSIKELDAIYERAMQQAEANKLLMQDRTKRLLGNKKT